MNAATSTLLREAATPWASWMFEMAWQVGLLVILLATVSVLLRHCSARLRYALWLLIVVRLLLPPGFAFPTGWGWWLRPGRAAVSSDAEHVVRPLDGSRQQVNRLGQESEATAASSKGLGALSWSVLLMIGWLGIVAARCGMLLTAGLQVRVWVSRARPIVDPTVLGLLEASRRRVGVRRAVELRNSESCATPLVVGVWRPVMLLPSAVLERLDSHELRAVLIHELYHVKRWDGVVNLLQGVLGAVYFFHPLVWWANRRIRQLREDACDERTVAALEGRRKPYGEAIFKVAEILGYAAPPLALGVLDSKAPIKQRLSRILDPRLPAAGRLGWPSVLAVMAAGVILIPGGARPAPSAGMARASQVGSITLERIVEYPQVEVAGPAASATDSPSQGAMGEAETRTEESGRLDDEAIDALAHELTVPQRRAAAVEVLTSLGSAAEPAVLRLLDGGDQATRMAIYEVLERVGTEASILSLQKALLARDESEQIRIERALDSVYGRLEVIPSERGSSVNSLRIFK